MWLLTTLSNYSFPKGRHSLSAPSFPASMRLIFGAARQNEQFTNGSPQAPIFHCPTGLPSIPKLPSLTTSPLCHHLLSLPQHSFSLRERALIPASQYTCAPVPTMPNTPPPQEWFQEEPSRPTRLIPDRDAAANMTIVRRIEEGVARLAAFIESGGPAR